VNKCYVYLISCGDNNVRPTKVGVSDDPYKRIKELQTGNPRQLKIEFIIECSDREHAFHLEKTIHEVLFKRHLRGEWFSMSGHKALKVLTRLSNDPSYRNVKNIEKTERAKRKDERIKKNKASLVKSYQKKFNLVSKENTNLIKKLRKRKSEKRILFQMLIDSGINQEEILSRLKES